MMAQLSVRKRLSGWLSTMTMSSRKGVSQVTIPTQRPEWYMERVAECLAHAQRMTSDSNSTILKVYQQQCKYLAEQLETAFKNSQESVNRSFSVEHKAECLDTVKVLYRVAKEVERFIGDCCSETLWIQAALAPASVPMRVCSWGCDLKLCSEVLRNSNKLGAAWLACSQVEGWREAELVAVKEMALNDEDSLRRSLESVTSVRSGSKSNIVDQDIELGTILLERLKAKSCGDSSASSNLEAWKVDRGGLRRGELIGRGTSSLVYKAGWFGAMEVFVREFDASSRSLFEKESTVMLFLAHPKIVSFLGYTTDSHDRNFIVLELMDGNLSTLMLQIMQEDSAREAPFSMWVACDIMLQVAEGVEYMHRNRVVHRDLKSINILVRSSKDNDGEHVCAKVSDFWLSKTKERSRTYSNQTCYVGTTRWMAPELAKGLGYKGRLETSTTGGVLKHPFKSDVYSFGILCYEILTGAVPFEELSPRKVREVVLEGHRPELPRRLCPQSLKNLIELCWDPEPRTRPSFAQICEELEFIRCSLLLEPVDQDNTCQPAPPAYEALDLKERVSRFKEEYFALKVERQLAKGGSDIVNVYLSTWHQTDNRVVRVAQKRFNGSHNQCFVNEVSIMADLEHSNVVRLLCYATDRRSCSIVMELMDEDLHDLMCRQMRLEGNENHIGPFSMDDAVDVILQIALGMEYVHAENVVHRDLKSCNILVRKGIEGRQLVVKVADFGVSMKLKPRDTMLKRDLGEHGTMRWMAPELLDDRHDVKYDPFKSDVFSFGMVCYEILVGRVPFYELENLNEVKESILRGDHPLLPAWTPSYLKVLIEKCWDRNGSRRPSFANIVLELAQNRVQNRSKTLKGKHAHVS